VTGVELSRAAVDDIARLRVTHSLPPDTTERVRASLRALEQFPRLGTALESPEWKGFRFLLGPWRWMVIVYEIYDDGDRVVVVTVQDGRSSIAAVAHR
jgi:plasmid stabilization system protein ParE